MKTGTISKNLTVDPLTGRFVITIIPDGSADEEVLTIGWYERPYPHKGDRVAYSLSPARLEIINGKEHAKTAKPEPETPEDTLVSLDLETTMDGETVLSWGLATLKGGRIRKEQGMADTEGNWKRPLIQILTSAKAITGHNVFGHDYRKLFGKSVPEHIQAKTWDTWEREQVLEPLRHSFALRTTHRPDEDAANALMLAASQIRRTATATEEQKENMKTRNEPLYRLLLSLISGLPHDIPDQESLLYPRRDATADMKAFTGRLPDTRTLLIAPKELWSEVLLARPDADFIDLTESGTDTCRYGRLDGTLFGMGPVYPASLNRTLKEKPFFRSLIKDMATIGPGQMEKLAVADPTDLNDNDTSDAISIYKPKDTILLWPELYPGKATEIQHNLKRLGLHGRTEHLSFSTGKKKSKTPKGKKETETPISHLIRSRSRNSAVVFLCDNMYEESTPVLLAERYGFDFVRKPADRFGRRIEICAPSTSGAPRFTFVNTDTLVHFRSRLDTSITLIRNADTPSSPAESAYLGQVLESICGTGKARITSIRFQDQSDRSERNRELFKARIRTVVKDIWGYDSLYNYQEKAIDIVCHPSRRTCLITFPTGGGKSLVFQAPVLADAVHSVETRGFMPLSIVISPLTALIRDQVEELSGRIGKGRYSGILGGCIRCIDASSSDEEQEALKTDLKEGKIALLYISPERLRYESFSRLLSKPSESGRPLSRIIFDEAHCIEEWGEGFRPDYVWAARWSTGYKKMYPDTQIILLSATVTPFTNKALKREFGQYVKVNAPTEEKPRLYSFEKISSKSIEAKTKILAGYVKARKYPIGTKALQSTSKMLVYTRRRKDAEAASETWNELSKTKSGFFHAGRTGEEKERIQAQFASREGTKERLPVLFATKAFGLGVNIPDIHISPLLGIPDTIEEYVQQIGRSGRDSGLLEQALGGNPVPAPCIYSEADLDRLDSPKMPYDWNMLKRFFDNLREYGRSMTGDTGGFFPFPLSTNLTGWTEDGYRITQQLMLNVLSDTKGLDRIEAGYRRMTSTVFRLLKTETFKTPASKPERLLNMLIHKARKERTSDGFISVSYKEMLENKKLNISDLKQLLNTIKMGESRHLFCQCNQRLFPGTFKLEKLTLNRIFNKRYWQEYKNLKNVTEELTGMIEQACIEFGTRTFRQTCMNLAEQAASLQTPVYVHELFRKSKIYDKTEFLAALLVMIQMNVFNLAGPDMESIEIKIKDETPLDETRRKKDLAAKELLENIGEERRASAMKMKELVTAGTVSDPDDRDETTEKSRLIQSHIKNYMEKKC